MEARINSVPNFPICIEDKQSSFDIHFLALFSDKHNAVPVILLHGWPGSFLEFLEIFELFRAKYTPETLPYHIIVPSWPGYGFSSPPPTDNDFSSEDVARTFDKLMNQLGFGGGYIAQGGDLGSKVARILAVKYSSIKAVHLNYCFMPDPGGISESNYSTAEMESLAHSQDFILMGSAYSIAQATRPSTIGFTLSSSPIALLAWVGEKFLDWADEAISIEKILMSVSLYWLTDCVATWMYPYRERFSLPPVAGNPDFYIHKPMGFSWFPKEIGAVPRAWIEKTGNLVFFRPHKQGGHFAALENPVVLLEDLEDFIASL